MSLSAALFVGSAPIARDVTLPDGSTHTLLFRQLPAAEFRRYFLATQSKSEKEQVAAMGKLIAASLVDEDGKPAITAEQAMQLTPAAERAISEAVLAINGLDGKAGKD